MFKSTNICEQRIFLARTMLIFLRIPKVGVAYDSDIDIAISAVRTAVSRIEGLSTDRVSQIGIARFGDSAIEIEARVWVQTRKFHEARFEANYVISGALDKAGIGIPFPQRVVRLVRPRN